MEFVPFAFVDEVLKYFSSFNYRRSFCELSSHWGSAAADFQQNLVRLDVELTEESMEEFYSTPRRPALHPIARLRFSPEVDDVEFIMNNFTKTVRFIEDVLAQCNYFDGDFTEFIINMCAINWDIGRLCEALPMLHKHCLNLTLNHSINKDILQFLEKCADHGELRKLELNIEQMLNAPKQRIVRAVERIILQKQVVCCKIYGVLVSAACCEKLLEQWIADPEGYERKQYTFGNAIDHRGLAARANLTTIDYPADLEFVECHRRHPVTRKAVRVQINLLQFCTSTNILFESAENAYMFVWY